MGLNGYNYALQHFDRKRLAEKYIGYLKSISKK
jgi:hypothetical protein